jgi:hypothetical protein
VRVPTSNQGPRAVGSRPSSAAVLPEMQIRQKKPHSIKSRSMSRVRDDETRSSVDVTPKNNNKNTTIRKMKTSSNAQEYHNSGEVKVQLSEIQKVIPKSRSQSRSTSKNRSRSKGKYSSTL